MKNLTAFLIPAIGVMLLLVLGYIFCGCGRKSSLQQEILGTWTTESGIEKLIISKDFLIYTAESYHIKDTCKYVIKRFDDKEKVFFLYPTKDNEIGILGAFEKIEYRGRSLFGSILIHDMGVNITEFRKEW